MAWSSLSSANEYPPVVIGEEEGFVDLSFQLQDVKNNLFTVKGTLLGSKVSFTIELLPEWKPQQVEGIDQPLYWGEANFKSKGQETKNFILKLAKLYGAELSDFEVPGTIYAQVVGLACNPQEILSSPCEMKFFFNPEGEEDYYSEIYINIDVNSRSLEFNEKDVEYRAPLLRSLLGQA